MKYIGGLPRQGQGVREIESRRFKIIYSCLQSSLPPSVLHLFASIFHSSSLEPLGTIYFLRTEDADSRPS